jgi:hypothetical protein
MFIDHCRTRTCDLLLVSERTPRLGASRDEDETRETSKSRVQDSEDRAAQFEADCRRLRLELQKHG